MMKRYYNLDKETKFGVYKNIDLIAICKMRMRKNSEKLKY